MQKSSKTWWDNKLHKYAGQDFVTKPSIFIKEIEHFFPANSKILEIGAGHGQDSIYLAAQGSTITSTDFSDTALMYLKKAVPKKLKTKIKILKLDITEKFPFEQNQFDIVYSHLSFHYFDLETTKKIIQKLLKILKPNGIFALIVNSIDDPEYKTGKKLDQDFYELAPGDIKRFFSVESLGMLMKPYFEILLLDNKGTTHKDKEKGVNNLIRFVGRKISTN